MGDDDRRSGESEEEPNPFTMIQAVAKIASAAYIVKTFDVDHTVQAPPYIRNREWSDEWHYEVEPQLMGGARIIWTDGWDVEAWYQYDDPELAIQALMDYHEANYEGEPQWWLRAWPPTYRRRKDGNPWWEEIRE